MVGHHVTNADLTVACATCGAPAEQPCRNDLGHPVPWLHIDRIIDARAGLHDPAD